MQPAYSAYTTPDACPVALDMAGKVMSLPMGPYLDPAAATHVAATLLDAIGERLPERGDLLASSP